MDSTYAEKPLNDQTNSLKWKLKLYADVSLLFGGFAHPLLIEEDENYTMAESVGKLLDGVDNAIGRLNLGETAEYSFRREMFKTIISGAFTAAGGLHERVRMDEIRAVLLCADNYARDHFPDELEAGGFWEEMLESV